MAKRLQVIAQTPQHKYQILTRRESILQAYCAQQSLQDNLWIGGNVESAKVKHRIDILREIPAHFPTFEPRFARP